MNFAQAFGVKYLVSLLVLPIVMASPLAFMVLLVPIGLLFAIALRVECADELAISAALFTWIGVIATARYLAL